MELVDRQSHSQARELYERVIKEICTEGLVHNLLSKRNAQFYADLQEVWLAKLAEHMQVTIANQTGEDMAQEQVCEQVAPVNNTQEEESKQELVGRGPLDLNMIGRPTPFMANPHNKYKNTLNPTCQNTEEAIPARKPAKKSKAKNRPLTAEIARLPYEELQFGRGYWISVYNSMALKRMGKYTVQLKGSVLRTYIPLSGDMNVNYVYCKVDGTIVRARVAGRTTDSVLLHLPTSSTIVPMAFNQVVFAIDYFVAHASANLQLPS